MIDVINLQKSYGELEVLKNINVTIHEGEKVAIIGPSGSGKSTFLRCLNCMEAVSYTHLFGCSFLIGIACFSKKRAAMAAFQFKFHFNIIFILPQNSRHFNAVSTQKEP